MLIGNQTGWRIRQAQGNPHILHFAIKGFFHALDQILVLLFSLFLLLFLGLIGQGAQIKAAFCMAINDPITGETKRKAPSDSAKPACDWATAHSSGTVLTEAPFPKPPQTLDRQAAPAMETALWRPAHDPRGLYARGPPSLV